MHDVQTAIGIMSQLRQLEVDVSLDDFGTGYSSLSYLTRFPIQALKIDQSFVHNITSDPGSATIAYAIIAMAHSLGLSVVAEGVETQGQLALLCAHECNKMQGYLFSKPVPADQVTQLMRERRTLAIPPRALVGQTLLLVDDEENVLSSLKRSLRSAGYRILTADNPVKAVELLAQNIVQVIVSDQRMPGMNGNNFFGNVKQLYPDTMRIMLSGYTELTTVTDAINRGGVQVSDAALG